MSKLFPELMPTVALAVEAERERCREILAVGMSIGATARAFDLAFTTSLPARFAISTLRHLHQADAENLQAIRAAMAQALDPHRTH